MRVFCALTAWSCAAATSNQTRFLLLSTQRSGTHFAMAQLRRHPDIFTYEEIFYLNNVADSPAAFERGLRVFFGLEAFAEGVLYEGLDKYFASGEVDARPVRGAVVQYNQLVDWDAVVDIAERLDVKLIHLWRQAHDRVAVSRFLNNHKGAQCIRADKKAAIKRHTAEIKAEVKTYRRRVADLAKRQHWKFKTAEITYEGLTDRADHELQRLYRFLRVPATTAALGAFKDRGPNQVKLHPQAVPIGDYFYRGDTCPWAEARAKAARARATES